MDDQIVSMNKKNTSVIHSTLNCVLLGVSFFLDIRNEKKRCP